MEMINKIVSLYGKHRSAFMDYLIALGADEAKAEQSKEDGLSKDWFNTCSDELGMTPKEYVQQGFGGDIDAKNAAAIFDAFACDSCWSVPEGVCKLLADFGEEGISHIIGILQNTQGLTQSYYDSIDKDALAAQDRFISTLNCIGYFKCDEVRKAAWAAFDACLAENEAIIESAADAIAETFGAAELAEHLSTAESIGFKELTLMQNIVNSGETSDELYRCLRKCVKMSGAEEKLTALSIFADYGDPRAVTLLRSVAKEMKEKLVPGQRNDSAFQELYMVASMINKLGGNTEDIIGM